AAKNPSMTAANRSRATEALTRLSIGPSASTAMFGSVRRTALIYAAYGDGGFNTSMSVRGGPDWANETVYAVEGVSAAAATPRQMRLMLQSLLEERFALKVHDASDTDAAVG